MSINYNEKIEKINNDRILMLKMVRESVNKNNISLSESLDTILSCLNVDEKNVKEYKSVVKAKQLIFELTEQISTATSVEEIINLRKRINYYINKIKKEMIKRNISQDLLFQMNNNVTYLRKNISMYIRFLKRESTLVEIKDYYKNIDSLSPESIVRFKKLLTNESKYNKRVLKNMHNKQENVSKNVKKKSSPIVENVTATDFVIPPQKEKQQTDDIDKDLDLLSKQINKMNPSNQLQSNTESVDFNTINLQKEQESKDEKWFLDFLTKLDGIFKDSLHEENLQLYEVDLTKNLEIYKSRYHFAKLYCYSNTFLKNSINFLRNIPRYFFNKQIIKRAEIDYEMFYHGEDLRAFIDYSKKRNSIRIALAIIFNCTRLSKREIQCLSSHDRCKEWIIEFYNKQNYIYNDNMRLIRTR